MLPFMSFWTILKTPPKRSKSQLKSVQCVRTMTSVLQGGGREGEQGLTKDANKTFRGPEVLVSVDTLARDSDIGVVERGVPEIGGGGHGA